LREMRELFVLSARARERERERESLKSAAHLAVLVAWFPLKARLISQHILPYSDSKD